MYATFGLESWRTASISTSVTSGIENQLSGLNRAFSAAFMDDRIPGALPQAKAHTAPLALNTYKRGEAQSYIQPWVLSCSFSESARAALQSSASVIALIPTPSVEIFQLHLWRYLPQSPGWTKYRRAIPHSVHRLRRLCPEESRFTSDGSKFFPLHATQCFPISNGFEGLRLREFFPRRLSVYSPEHHLMTFLFASEHIARRRARKHHPFLAVSS